MLEPQRPTTSSEAMVYFLIMVIIALIVLVVRVSLHGLQVPLFGELPQGHGQGGEINLESRR